MESHAHIFCRYQLYHVEAHPSRKLIRIASLLETLIKYHNTVAMAEYFKSQQWSEKDMDLFIQSLRGATLSLWRTFGRELFYELVNEKHAFLLPSFAMDFLAMEEHLERSGNTIFPLVRSFAKGMASSDNKSLKYIHDLTPRLEAMLNSKWLKDSRLIVNNGMVHLISENKQLPLHPLMVFNPGQPNCSYGFFDEGGSTIKIAMDFL